VSGVTRRYLISAVLLGAATLLGGSLRRGQSHLTPAAFGLDALPLQIGGFRGREQPLNESAFGYLEADEMIERVYVNPEETGTVKLSVVFARGWRALHSQRACLTNQGWTVIEDGSLDVPTDDEPLHATRLVLERSGVRIVVVYMFVTGEATTGSWFHHSVRMALGGSRRGGALLSAVAPSESPTTDREATETAEGIVREATDFMQARWEVQPRSL